MTLFINACVGGQSRTEQIARAYLKYCSEVTELELDSLYFEPVDASCLENRNRCIDQGVFTHRYFDHAHQFAQADEIVIAAPFWDLSFPAKLRTYLENICIPGLTFRYSENGIPIGMCKAKKLTYITTSGGPFLPDYSFNYIRSLVSDFFGIPEVNLIYAENLDVVGNDPKAIVADCIHRYCEQAS